jgi:hypothetical protein
MMPFVNVYRSKNDNFKVKKSDLPKKICAVCKRPFTWRKKWEKDWNNVKYCSERCRRNKNNEESD